MLDSNCRHDIFNWIDSEDGWKVNEHLIADAWNAQTVDQFALTIAALMSFRYFFPASNFLDRPIHKDYLADLDAYLRGDPFKNTSAVLQQTALALVRVLRAYGDVYEDLFVFVETVLDLGPPLLCESDELLDQYLILRFGFDIDHHDYSRTHDAALETMARTLHFGPSELSEVSDSA